MKWRDSNVTFEPWPGDNPSAEYLNGIGRKRVLILGESHYHDCEDDESCINCATKTAREDYHRRLTRTVVGGWCERDRRSPISYRVLKLFGPGAKRILAEGSVLQLRSDARW